MIEVNYAVPEMITLKEASKRTGVSYDFLRKMCLSNQIVHVKAVCKYLVNWGKLVEYLNRGVSPVQQ